MMDARIGAGPPDSPMRPGFIRAGRELRGVLFSGSRDLIVHALDMDLRYVKEARGGILRWPVPLDRRRRCGDFALPSRDLLLAFRT
jgi:hypothetical protein